MSISKLPGNVHIHEKSWLARLAAWKLHTRSVALVIGNTIHLHGVSPQNFLANPKWVRHELKHVEQYQRLGKIRFLTSYFIEWIRHGYYHNKFEKEARAAEE